MYLNKINANKTNHTRTFQLTTVFYPDDQIASYRNVDRNRFDSTTPMNIKSTMHAEHRLENLQATENVGNTAAEELSLPLRSVEIFRRPQNHRKRYAESSDLDAKNIFPFRSDAPTGFKIQSNSKSRIVFPDEKSEYSSATNANMNNIRDILDQTEENDNNFTDIGSTFASSIPRGRGVRIEGTYRRHKNHNMYETLDSLHSMTNIQRVPTGATEHYQKRPNDPFSKFKPSSPSDINLLALNQFRFAPYRHQHQKLRPFIAMPELLNTFGGVNQGVNHDPEFLYNQIIMTNNNRLKESASTNSRNENIIKKKQKPFNLMLDVYPMEDDDSNLVSSTKKPPINNYRRPLYPHNAINHNNLQYASDNSYYNYIKFPQLQQYQTPIDLAHYHNSMHFRNFMNNRPNNNLNLNQYRSAQSPPFDVQTDNTPSQITVHLNLYPNTKKHKVATNRTKNVEVIAAPEPERDEQFNKRMEYGNVLNKVKSDSYSLEKQYLTSAAVPPLSQTNFDSFESPRRNLAFASARPIIGETFGYSLSPSDSNPTSPSFHPIESTTIEAPTSNVIYSTAIDPSLLHISSSHPTVLPKSSSNTIFTTLLPAPLNIVNYFTPTIADLTASDHERIQFPND